MKNHKAENSTLPIGIFDSGIGGLTVVRAIRKIMPNEDLIYLGDTARVPYGTKSPETVKRFATEDASFLVSQNVKAIVVACNTVSAWALPELRRRFDLPVFGVIEPGVITALEKTRNFRIGVIGTSTTIRSRSYIVALNSLCKNVKAFAKACPLLVPLVEEGWTNHRVTNIVLSIYLKPILRKKIDTLILGCTHYPLLKNAIKKVVGSNVVLVDSAQACAKYVRLQLMNSGLLNPSSNRRGSVMPYVTDEPDHFTQLADRFLGEKVEHAFKVELKPFD